MRQGPSLPRSLSLRRAGRVCASHRGSSHSLVGSRQYRRFAYFGLGRSEVSQASHDTDYFSGNVILSWRSFVYQITIHHSGGQVMERWLLPGSAH
jgi:hypothetical protein